jgi:hypothetical protein
MSLMSAFITSNLLPAIESELLAHEPEIQAQIINELGALSLQIGEWVAAKSSSILPSAPASE